MAAQPKRKKELQKLRKYGFEYLVACSCIAGKRMSSSSVIKLDAKAVVEGEARATGASALSLSDTVNVDEDDANQGPSPRLYL